MKIHTFLTVFFTIILFCHCSTTGEGTDFRWDFSSEKKYIYSYNQNSIMVFDDITAKHKDKIPSSLEGKLNIKVKSKEYADLSLTNLKLDQEGLSSDDDSGENLQTMVVQDMNSKGGFKTDDQDMLFKLMLPLPNENLKIGESEYLPMEIPFTTNGSVLFSKGGNTITYQKDTIINGEILAQLAAITDISKLDIPEEIEGEFEMSVTGSSQLLFNKAKGYFVSAIVHFKMESHSIIEQKIGESIHSMNSSMNMENTVKIQLLEIE